MQAGYELVVLCSRRTDPRDCRPSVSDLVAALEQRQKQCSRHSVVIRALDVTLSGSDCTVVPPVTHHGPAEEICHALVCLKLLVQTSAQIHLSLPVLL